MAGRLRAAAAILRPGAPDPTYLPWEKLENQHLRFLQAELVRNGNASATVNLTLAAVRGTIKTAWRLRLCDHESYNRAVDDLKTEPKPIEPAGRLVGRPELAALFAVAAQDSDPRRGARDAAVLAIAAGTGLRRNELAQLQLGSYRRASGDEAAHLTVLTKGRKRLVAYLPPAAHEALEQWLAIRGSRPGALFCRLSDLTKLTSLPVQPMHGQAIASMLARLATAADTPGLSPHDLRRTAISYWWSLGIDAATVQRMAGHASMDQTSRYDRRGAQAMAKAAARVTLPVSLPQAPDPKERDG